MKKVTLAELKTWLINAECRAVCDPDFIKRMDARDEVRRLKARIARRERDQAYADCGMVKVRGSMGGTYYE